jgi:hypothetical protein
LGTVGGEAQLGAALGVGLEVFDGDIDTGRKDAGDGFEMGAATAPVCCRPWPRPGLGDAEVVVAAGDERSRWRVAVLAERTGQPSGVE